MNTTVRHKTDRQTDGQTDRHVNRDAAGHRLRYRVRREPGIDPNCATPCGSHTDFQPILYYYLWYILVIVTITDRSYRAKRASVCLQLLTAKRALTYCHESWNSIRRYILYKLMKNYVKVRTHSGNKVIVKILILNFRWKHPSRGP